jgi:hypothetical protein
MTACVREQAVLVDNSPQDRAAVLTAKGAINGFALPDSTFKQRVYARKDRPGIATGWEYDSWMARKFIGNSVDTVDIS